MEIWFSEFHAPDVKHSIRVNRHLYSEMSDYQRIDIFDTPEFGRVLTLDGNVVLTERDEFIYDEMITHIPMAVHPDIQDVLVIGAGLIGLKCVEGILDRVKSVTVVDLADRIMPSVLDKEGGEMVQKGLEKKGVRFILSDSAEKFEKNVAYLKNSKQKI